MFHMRETEKAVPLFRLLPSVYLVFASVGFTSALESAAVSAAGLVSVFTLAAAFDLAAALGLISFPSAVVPAKGSCSRALSFASSAGYLIAPSSTSS